MTKRKITGLFIVLLAFNSCVEQIDFKLDKAENERLIVSGLLTDLDEPQIVYLSLTTSIDREPLLVDGNYTLDDKPRPFPAAQVKLVDETTGSTWYYQQPNPGVYVLEGFRHESPDARYYLEVSSGGWDFRSVPQAIPEVIGSDELSFSFERTRSEDNPDAAQVVIRTEATLPDQVGDYYLRWMVDNAYYWDLTFFPNPFNTPPPPCVVFGFPEPERITLVNGDLLDAPGTKITQIVAKKLVDQSFLSRHYFNVRQLSISKDAYEYWRRVREIVNNTGSVFDTPPAPIKGNMYSVNDPDEVVLGYFEVSKAKMTRIYTTLADVPYYLEKICEYQPGKARDQYDPTCLTCGAFPNSVMYFPSWWFDQ
ncbi:hypothetical protein GCM10009119_28930 [Algoriphagus jejuensis]|uniref:DUF4249 domain-containing protein n=1 Tax=Algoriphagus jejuensis TaxID=419934 RepID=A0ABN1N2Q9_9BACT